MNADILQFVNSNRESLHLITDLLPIPIFMKDRAGRYIDCNEAFKRFLSISREQLLGKTVYDIWSREEADVFFTQDEALFNQGGTQVYETKITSSAGIGHIVQFHKQVFLDSTGEVAGFLGAIFDITEKKNLESALARLAATDELTGLPNRREGMERLSVLVKDFARKRRAFCVAMVDIDHFKQLNDQHGHANGDQVLKMFADLVRKALRSCDICFRYGGEEFVVLLPDTSLIEGYAVVERLRQRWAETLLCLSDGQSVHSSISIGIAESRAESVQGEELIERSDEALYLAKSSGRNQTKYIEFSDPA